METVRCLVCSGDKFSSFYQQTGNDEYKSLVIGGRQIDTGWVQCSNCDLKIHQPQFTDEELNILYEKFRDYSIRSESPDDYFDRITSLPEFESENFQKSKWIEEHLPENFIVDSVFDVGCGGGVFLWTVRNVLGAKKIVGLEPTTSFAKLAARRLNTVVFDEPYQSPVSRYGTFSLVTVNQVLEHIKNPRNFATQLKENLVPGGCLYIEVPSEKDFAELPSDHDRFKAQHLCYFNEASLEHLFAEIGFECISNETTKTVRGRNNIQALFKLPEVSD